MFGTRASLAIPTVDCAVALSRGDVRFVDLRAPTEFAEDHVPGATNVPLLDDLSRALVGRLYNRVSPEAAFDEARARVRERLGDLVSGVAAVLGRAPPRAGFDALFEDMTRSGIDSLERDLETVPTPSLPAGAAVLHCWRGGLRSRSVIAFLRALGFEELHGLAQGYKGYRAHVRAALESWRAPPTYVLRGLTGVGKTLVLRELERLRPGWTLDLEGLAGHRSSVLGAVGLAPLGQKSFESALCQRLRELEGRVLVLEGESRKVGDRIVPDAVWAAMEGGTSIELQAEPARRALVLCEDYVADSSRRAQLRAVLPFLEQRMGSNKYAGRLVALLDEGRDEELALLLLSRYYDPRYRHSGARHAPAVAFDATDPVRAASEVARWIDARAWERRVDAREGA